MQTSIILNLVKNVYLKHLPWTSIDYELTVQNVCSVSKPLLNFRLS